VPCWQSSSDPADDDTQHSQEELKLLVRLGKRKVMAESEIVLRDGSSTADSGFNIANPVSHPNYRQQSLYPSVEGRMDGASSVGPSRTPAATL